MGHAHSPPSPHSPLPLVVTLCVCEALVVNGVFTFPTLIPHFTPLWQLSATEAGAIAGAYFLGYMLAAPLLVTLTDRIDARRIFILGAVISAAASLGFALLAEGVWSALGLRLLAGVGLAGCYMPGLKALSDRYTGSRQSRYVSIYTASFSLGSASSYLSADLLNQAFGWQWAFAATGLASLVAALLIALLLAPKTPLGIAADQRLLDFRPVLRNRPALGYIIAYGGHCWELLSMRSWAVAFLVFAAASSGTGGWPSPAVIAIIASAIGMVSSIGGQELMSRLGARRVLAPMMIASALCALVVGGSGSLGYGMAVMALLLYATLIYLDSGSLTACVLRAADARRQGATLALYSMCGFFAGFAASLSFGVALDVAGGRDDPQGWAVAFASLGVVALATVPIMRRLTATETPS